MLQGNDILVRGTALFQRKFKSALQCVSSPPYCATRRLVEKSHAFLYEAIYYFQGTQMGQLASCDLDMSKKQIRLFSLFHLYRTVENFLLNLVARQSEHTDHPAITIIEKQLKDISLGYLFALIPAMRLNHTNVNNLFTGNDQSWASTILEETIISNDLYENLARWERKFLQFRRNPQVVSMNYASLHSSYHAGVEVTSADIKIRTFLQNEYRDFQSFYLGLHNIVSLFSLSIVDPAPANSELAFLNLLLNLYREMIATAIFVEQAQYALVLETGTGIYVNRASFFWKPSITSAISQGDNVGYQVSPMSQVGSRYSILTASSGYSSSGSIYVCPPLIPPAPVYELPPDVKGSGVSMAQCRDCLNLYESHMLIHQICSACRGEFAETMSL